VHGSVFLAYSLDEMWGQRRGQRMLAGENNAVRRDASVQPQINDKFPQLHRKSLNLIMLVGHGRPELHGLARTIEQLDANMVRSRDDG